MPIGATSFPASLDSLVTLIQQHDGAITTLSVDMTAGATELTCADTSNFPATSVMVIEGEEIGYSGKTPTTLTGLTRGLFQAIGGSAPAPHTAGAAIELLVIAGTHKVQNDAIIATQTKVGAGASVPSAGTVFKGTGPGASAWGALTSGEITGALGYTPLNKAGDTISGTLAIANGGVTAATGVVRLPFNQAITARNAANTGDVNLLHLDGTDVMQLRGGAAHITAAGFFAAANLWADAVVESGGSIRAASFISAGVNPAASGALRMPSDQWLRSRNNGNTADIDLIKASAGGDVIVGPASGITISSSGAVTLASDLPVASGGTGASDAAGARTNLGAQASHGNLSALSGLSLIADRLPYANGAGTMALATLTAGGRAVVGLAAAADRFPYWTSASVAALGTITAAGRALLDDADAAEQRSTLGLGGVSQILSASVKWDPASVPANSSTTTIFTVTGVASGDVVAVSHLFVDPTDGLIMRGYATNPNEVRVKLINVTGSSINVNSQTLRIVVFKL